MANHSCYGYNTTSSGGLTINESKSKIVRWIFERYLARDCLGKIVTGLQKQNTPSPSGMPKWSREAICKLLLNEKYTGSVLLQKTLNVCGMQFKNGEKFERVLIRNNHEANITSQDFDHGQ